MPEPVSREEYIAGMQRVHERVDTVEKTTSSIETSAKNIERCVCNMEKVMYGSERGDGIITKVSNLAQKVGGLFWFGGVTIVALVGTLVSVAIAAIFKKSS